MNYEDCKGAIERRKQLAAEHAPVSSKNYFVELTQESADFGYEAHKALRAEGRNRYHVKICEVIGGECNIERHCNSDDELSDFVCSYMNDEWHEHDRPIGKTAEFYRALGKFYSGFGHSNVFDFFGERYTIEVLS